LLPFQTQEKCFIWDCYDCSDTEPRFTKFAARFKNLEEKATFSKAFTTAKEENLSVVGQKKKEECKEEIVFVK